MGDHYTTRYVKGVIIPTVDSVETWITHKTGTLREFIQILRRTHCTLYIFKPRHVQHPTWEDYSRDHRTFYVGDVKQWIYDTLLEKRPDLMDAPLWAYGRDTPLARDLMKLYKRTCLELYKDPQYWDGYYDRSRIPEEYWQFQPPTAKRLEKGIVRMFKIPGYDWLRRIVNTLGSKELRLPEELANEQPLVNASRRPAKIARLETAVIDIETTPASDSFLKKLEINSVQIADATNLKDKGEYITDRDGQKARILRAKHLVAYNAPFEQTQLARNEINPWKNDDKTEKKWTDVALMVRTYDNRLIETRKTKLEDAETALLGTKTKKETIAKLETKYKVSIEKVYGIPNVAQDPLFQEYALNDIHVTRRLYHFLRDRELPALNVHFKTFRRCDYLIECDYNTAIGDSFLNHPCIYFSFNGSNFDHILLHRILVEYSEHKKRIFPKPP